MKIKIEIVLHNIQKFKKKLMSKIDVAMYKNTSLTSHLRLGRVKNLNFLP